MHTLVLTLHLPSSTRIPRRAKFSLSTRSREMVRFDKDQSRSKIQFIFYSSDFLKLRDLRNQNPELKIMISLTNYFREISANLRTEFSNHLKNFLVEYEIDGADIDFEFPAVADRENFVLLLREVKKFLQPINKFLSIAVDPCLLSTSNGYDVPSIMEEIDFATLMLYDMHGGGWQNYTANHGNFRHATSRYNVVTCVKSWIDAGAVKEKLVVGIPTYSRNFQLNDASNNGVGALATFKDFGKPGEIPVTYPYFTICQNIKNNGWRRYYEHVKSSGPYVVYDKIWAGYDDVESISEKVRFVDAGGYAGVGFWSLDHDDYSNICGDGSFPLIKSVWN